MQFDLKQAKKSTCVYNFVVSLEKSALLRAPSSAANKSSDMTPCTDEHTEFHFTTWVLTSP